MKAKTALSLLLCLCSIAAFAQSPWTNYTNDRFINDVMVAGNNVWVGSQGGLTRTNMQTGEFETYLAGNSPILGGGIIEIERAPDNAIWMVSENAGLFQLKNGVWTHYYEGIISAAHHLITHLQILSNGDVWFFVDLRDQQGILNKLVRIRDGVIESFGNMPREVKSFAILDEHTIYISDGTTLHQYDASLQQVTQTYHSGNSIITTDDTFWEIIIDRNGALIIPCPARILQLKNGVISVLSTPGLHVNKAFNDGVGNVYLQPPTDGLNGIRLVKYNGNTVTYYKDIDLAPYPAVDAPLFRGADHQGKLYAVLFNVESEYTLFRFDENGWTPVKTQIYPLLDNYQEDVQSDCKGNLWFNSRNGIDVRYADGSWEHFPIDVGLHYTFRASQMTVHPVTCDVWFANNSNNGNATIPGIVRISNGTVTQFLPGHANVTDIEATADGKVYFFSGLHGFGYIENDEVHYIDGLDELIFIKSIDSDSKGNLYLTYWGPTIIKYDGQVMTHLGEGELSEYAFDVFVDNDDMVWTILSDGVKQYDGTQWNDYSHVWPSGNMNSLVQDTKGNYWVTTWLDGLYYWDKQTLQHYDIFNSGLSSHLLRSVALDPNGNLIVTQQVGATVLEIQGNTEAYKGTGNVFFDYAKDGVFNPGTDILVPGQKIRDTDRDLWVVTNSHGKYAFYTDTAGPYNYRHALEPYAESTTDNPQTAMIVDDQSILPDFGYWKPEIPDVNVDIVNGVPVCNRDFKVYIVLRNNSPYPLLGHFTLNFNHQLVLKESSLPVSQETSGQLIFEDITIEPLGTLVITLVFTAPGFSQENLSLFFKGLFDTSDGPFEGATIDSLLCSYDPNDKKVEPTGEFINDYSLIKDPLKYTIRFQNEGTYKAFDIAIIDTLDQHLDPSTFELVASSHDVETTVTADGIITFLFPNIDLPTRSDDDLGSQGFVSFTIWPDSNLTGAEQILNDASIYFDFNPPIVTNTTSWHVVDDLAIVGTNEVHAQMSVWPNPTEGTLYLTMDTEGEYHVMDATGRQVDAGNLQYGSNTIQLDIPSGIYYLQVRDMAEVYAPVKVAVIR